MTAWGLRSFYTAKVRNISRSYKSLFPFSDSSFPCFVPMFVAERWGGDLDGRVGIGSFVLSMLCDADKKTAFHS